MDSNQNEFGTAQMRHVDWISTLPDYIISDMILSRLCTKDSVRTSVLSSRWKHLYASVAILDFKYKGESGVVFNFLNRLPCIPKFRLVSIDSGVAVKNSDIIYWIDSATSRYVEELDIYIIGVKRAAMPHSLFTCETLVYLSLCINLKFSVPDIVCLPKLKELLLKDISWDKTDDESVKRLLSSCPVLEKLLVMSNSMYYDARVFNVSIPSLKVLGLYLWRTEVELLINCPNLEELSCECYAVKEYSGDVLGSMKICDITVESLESQFGDGKLIKLVSQLGGDSMQALIPPRSLPSFENLTHLDLKSDAPDGWQLLPILLDRAPRLNTLEFVGGFLDLDEYFGNPFPPPEHVPVCVSNHLKVIKFNKFVGEENEYKWVEYFLTNALVLEKMEICLWSSENSYEEYDPSGEGEDGGEGEGLGEGQGEEQGQGKGNLTRIWKDILQSVQGYWLYNGFRKVVESFSPLPTSKRIDANHISTMTRKAMARLY